MQTLTDSEIIAKHSHGARARATIELSIVNKLIETAATSGFKLEVWPTGEGEEYGEGEAYDVKTALFNLDDAFVHVFNTWTSEDLGWVRLVFGNNGYDLVSDYSVNLDGFLAPVLALSE